MKLLVLFLFTTFSVFVNAQGPTLGLIYSSGLESEGYTLFSPTKTSNVYLVNNCGERVNEWTFSEKPGLTCYLLENGNVLRAGKDSLEIRDWDNNIVWSYAMTANGLLQHHDIEPLPNGNILCVITDQYTSAEITEYGRNPAITVSQLTLDKLVEIQPNGPNDASIVWEWKFLDHLIQDYDSTKLKFGAVGDHPELIDINYANGQQNDYTHVNGIDYNEELDQVIISVRNLSEVIIIDHSTTTAEAAGHSGGDYGAGGDLLWRWGNPQVYHAGTSADQKLFLQHDVKWVEEGYLDHGKISVFNNGGDGLGTHSSVHLIEPDITANMYTMTGDIFSPSDFDWSWNGSLNGTNVKEGKKSGCHALPNGNFIICESSSGRVSEITKSGDHVWSYINPEGITIYSQFTSTASSLTTMFRGEKYPLDYPAFAGKDLSSIGILEDQNTLTDTCVMLNNIEETNILLPVIINPIINRTIEFVSEIHSVDELRLVDLQGRVLFSTINPEATLVLPPSIQEGMYVVQLRKGSLMSAKTVFIQ